MNNDNFTTAARAEAPPVCEHYWISHSQDSALIPWVIRCGSCGAFNTAEMDRAARDHLAAQEPTDAALPENVANLIRDLIDPDDCWFDHHGGCQAHGYLELTPEQECPHSEAKRLIAASAARRDEESTP